MAYFLDQKGRNWPVLITVADVRRVKKLTGVDLYALVDDGCKGLGELLGDVCLFVDVLFLLVADVAAACTPPVADEDFGRALGGDSLAAASDAFMEALIDFFPGGKARESLRRVIAKGREVADLAARMAADRVGDLDVPKEAQSLLDRLAAGSRSSASAPAGSGSIPGRGPSAR